MSVLDQALAAARAGQFRVVLPEMDDPRIADAAARLRAEGLAQVVTLADARPAEAYVEHLLANRPGLKPALALRMLDKPLIRAAAMVAAGEADTMVAGAANATRRVIEAAALAVGMADGVQTPSSFFLMLLPDGRELVFADCGVNTSPDAAQLADIARASAATARGLFGEARVALLSYSTGASGAGPSVETVRAAAQASGFPGPVQADAALNASIAAKKGYDAPPANTLIFPDLNSGNIAYKLMQELGGAQALGPFLQGFAKPICDLSRGATVEDIVAATLVTLTMVNKP
ncbi:phosphate acyltransferase [Pararhodobacter zhoushanensis]|uniref:Phosphate acyltransferase n=1 Tax=Pararhodobacter zhoushanensis TaxID=2479545 RepID=A0ABT3GVJ9_9RHOB|nr:phosphate acyltransferase [Pararhodobacter zhoushanensis]MCW1931571.1 phosphate acyltransferase [Pararhodobacter zhoushanensis]